VSAAAVGAPWQRLSLAGKGFVVGAAALGTAAPAVAEALADGEGPACAAVLRALFALADTERAAAVDALVAEVNAPVPAGVGGVHGDWLRAALEGESTPVLRALVAGLPAAVGAAATAILAARGDDPTRDPDDALDPDLLAEVQRAVFVDIVALPALSSGEAAPAGRPAWPALAAAGPDAVLEAVARHGAETLGMSLRGAPRAVIARAAAQIGEAGAARLMDAATAAGPAAVREGARAVTAAVGPEDAGFDPVFAIGVHALARSLADDNPDAPPTLAQRLPQPLGAMLLRAAERLRSSRPPSGRSDAQPRLK